MRNREVIEREMFRAREDLEQSVAQLKHIVQEKVDVKARARVAIERGKDKAALALERGADEVRQLAVRSKDGAIELYDKAQEHPFIAGAIVGGLLMAGVMFVGYRRDWFT
jgi:hypothetical protein